MHRQTDVAVIGAGQAGLALSHRLRARSIDHVVLERGEIGHRWLAERWPSLTLLSPNALINLPGLGPVGDNPDGYMRATDFARTLAAYCQRIGAPVETGCEVHSVRRKGQGFELRTSHGSWGARAVVVATGACDRARLPDWSGNLPREIHQVGANGYSGPAALPPGNVLVVGASATGVQLAAEIQASGRQVTLAVGRHVRTPRRYRGRDLLLWLHDSGFLYEPRSIEVSPERAMTLPSLQLSGSAPGIDVGLTELASAGVRMAGRAIGYSMGQVKFASTLEVECAAAEQRRQRLLSQIDQHIARERLSTPSEPEAWRPRPLLPAAPSSLDLKAAGIQSVVWAAGYRREYPWLSLPVLDRSGEIMNHGGLTPVPGLYALGLPFMRHRSSAFIYGVGRDAEALLPAIERHLERLAGKAA